jgi:hypothetical protein
MKDEEEKTSGVFGQVVEIEVVDGAIMLRVALPMPSPKNSDELEGEAKKINEEMTAYMRILTKIHPGEVIIYQD